MGTTTSVVQPPEIKLNFDNRSIFKGIIAEHKFGTQMIQLFSGDITKQAAEGLVNATSDTMEHQGGVSAAIAKMGGEQFFEQTKQSLAEFGPLKIGDVRVTDGCGDLPCKKVLHVVGPVWEGGEKGEEDQLRTIVKNCLAEVYALGLHSVAFPAISTGRFSFPEDKCAKIMMDEFVDFFKSRKIQVKLIRMVIYNTQVQHVFVDEFQRRGWNVNLIKEEVLLPKGIVINIVWGEICAEESAIIAADCLAAVQNSSIGGSLYSKSGLTCQIPSSCIIFACSDEKHRQKQHAWSWLSDNKDWINFPIKVNKEIERAYLSKQPSLVITLNEEIFEINLLTKVQINPITSSERKIQRKAVSLKLIDDSKTSYILKDKWKLKSRDLLLIPVPKTSLDVAQYTTTILTISERLQCRNLSFAVMKHFETDSNIAITVLETITRYLQSDRKYILNEIRVVFNQEELLNASIDWMASYKLTLPNSAHVVLPLGLPLKDGIKTAFDQIPTMGLNNGINFQNNQERMLCDFSLKLPKELLLEIETAMSFEVTNTPVPRLVSFIKQLQPMHRCSFEVFNKILLDGGLRSRNSLALERKSPPHVWSIGRVRNHGEFNQYLDKYDVQDDLRHAAYKVVELKVMLQVKNEYIEERQRVMEHFLRKLLESIPDFPVTILDKVATQVASRSLDQKLEGAGFEADVKLGTNNHVFAVLGANTYSSYGPIAIILKSDIMYHPDSNVTPLAAVMFFNSGRLPLRRPWSTHGYWNTWTETTRQDISSDAFDELSWFASISKFISLAQGKKETFSIIPIEKGIELFHKSKLHPNVPMWDILAIDLENQFRWLAEGYKKPDKFDHHSGNLTSKIKSSVGGVIDWYLNLEAHAQIEVHLPDFVPLSYVDEIVIQRSSTNDKILESLMFVNLPQNKNMKDILMIVENEEQMNQYLKNRCKRHSIQPIKLDKGGCFPELPWMFPQKMFDSTMWVHYEEYSLIEMFPTIKNGFEDVYDFVQKLWQQNVQTLDYSITKIVAIKNLQLQQVWERKLAALEIRSQQAVFKPRWSTENNHMRRQDIITRLEQFVLGNQGNVKIVPVFHGTSPMAIPEICKTGLANLGLTDSGYFGKGIYGTPQSDYAARVYGKGVCILCFVGMLNPYPVIYEDMPCLLTSGNLENYDVHYVPVVPFNSLKNVYYALKENESPVYDEVVVFQDSQIIPRYVVYYDQ